MIGVLILHGVVDMAFVLAPLLHTRCYHGLVLLRHYLLLLLITAIDLHVFLRKLIGVANEATR